VIISTRLAREQGIDAIESFRDKGLVHPGTRLASASPWFLAGASGWCLKANRQRLTNEKSVQLHALCESTQMINRSLIGNLIAEREERDGIQGGDGQGNLGDRHREAVRDDFA
jgi:hypothetical protein